MLDKFYYQAGRLHYKTGHLKDRAAGCQDSKGYIRLVVKRKTYSNARLIWEMHNSPIPAGLQIDHIDRILIDGKRVSLGNFYTAEEARDARLRAEKENELYALFRVRPLTGEA